VTRRYGVAECVGDPTHVSLPGSPAGSCVWHVVGLQRSIREWAMRQGWGGKPVRAEQAQGILVAALGMLARHYDYQRRVVAANL